MNFTLHFLDKYLIEKILEESYNILKNIGIKIHSKEVLQHLSEYGFKIDIAKRNVIMSSDTIDKTLKTVPNAFKLYNLDKKITNDFIENKIHFTPGSSAINILDSDREKFRKPRTKDYIKYVKVVEQLDGIASQSTAFIPSDVPEQISDSYRLFLSLLYGKKPVVTGMFKKESFESMYDMLIVIRGNKDELINYPNTLFTCCPVSPLSWSEDGAQNLLDCASNSIPVEIVSMPLAGFSSPVTFVGTLIQHTAEVLSGIVISQVINPGTPVLFGGAAAIFDMRYQTTPMGAIETMMLACGYNEIGKYLNIPTQAYISMSDSKQLDSQAGMETGMGAVMAGLSGINEIAGPGMLDFINGFSIEKLIFDNEICKQVLHMTKGISPKDDFPAIGIMQELLSEGHLIISNHTHQYLKQEQLLPTDIINRKTLSDWQNEGSKNIKQRIKDHLNQILNNDLENSLSENQKKALEEIMLSQAKKYGMKNLPKRSL